MLELVAEANSKDQENTPFPFLRLPWDVRHLIYQYTLHTKDSICPDVTGSLKLYTYHSEKRKEWYENHSVISDVTLLRTCKQIHTEASTVLYGKNSFSFDDWDYREKCISRRHSSCRCPGETDLNLFYTWLHMIGKANRLKLRQIRVIFSHPAYTICPGETRFRPDVKEQQYIEEENMLAQGKHLVDAFNLIAMDHNLLRIKLEFDNKGKWGKLELVRYFLFNGMDSRILQALSRITGLKDLELEPSPTCQKDEVTLQDLRRRMCRRRPVVDLGDSINGNSAGTPPRDGAASPSAPEVLSKKLLALAEERQASLDHLTRSRAQIANARARTVQLQEEIVALADETTALQLSAAEAGRKVERIDNLFAGVSRELPARPVTERGKTSKVGAGDGLGLEAGAAASRRSSYKKASTGHSPSVSVQSPGAEGASAVDEMAGVGEGTETLPWSPTPNSETLRWTPKSGWRARFRKRLSGRMLCAGRRTADDGEHEK